MTGYQSKRAAARDKLNDDDDTQVYGDALNEDAIIIQYHEATIKRLEKRIEELMAQPAQEPVAWLEPEWGEKICPEVGYEVTMTDDHPRDLCWIPLVAQRPWVGLTDEERVSFDATNPKTQKEWDELFDGIEDRLKEKNNG